MDTKVSIVPVIGMGATTGVGSDRYPMTVTRIDTARQIACTYDDYTRTDNNGLSESQQYTYAQNPNRPTVIFTLRKNGYWVAKGQSKRHGLTVYLGHRSAYQDPSF